MKQKLFVGGAALLFSLSAWSNPQLDVVRAGEVKIESPTPNTLRIAQSSQKAIIDWKSFSIDAGQHTHFDMAKSAVVLNRVTGKDPSHIMGNLSGNGTIFLVNPNNIIFGPQARVDVGSLIATTADIKNENFMAGKYHFTMPQDAPGLIRNEGNITVKDSGLVALVAPGVEHAGVINARLGKVTLAAGSDFTVDLAGDGLIHFAMDGGVNNARVVTKQMSDIYADGGRVELSAHSADKIVKNVINTKGLIQANTVSQRGGEIIIGGHGRGIVKVGGTLRARNSNPKASSAIFLMNNKKPNDNTYPEIKIARGANIDHADASGAGRVFMYAKGGSINADLEQASDLNYESLHIGTGSQFSIQAPDLSLDDHMATQVNRWLGNGASVTLSANGEQDFPVLNSTVPVVWHEASSLHLLANNSVIVLEDSKIEAKGDGHIVVAAGLDTEHTDTGIHFVRLDKREQGAPVLEDSGFELVQAHEADDFELIDSSEAKDMAVAEREDEHGFLLIGSDKQDGQRNEHQVEPLFVTNTGNIHLFHHSAHFPQPVDFSHDVKTTAGQIITPVYVPSIAALEQISTRPDGNYALARDLTYAPDTDAHFTPVGTADAPFTGHFYGSGHVLRNIKVDMPDDQVGVFGVIDGGTIQDLHVEGLSVRGNHEVGGLVGQLKKGTIQNVHVSGIVKGLKSVGGLVGVNQGQLRNVSMHGDVNGHDYVGGIAGTSHTDISQAVNHAHVTGLHVVGGVIGQHDHGQLMMGRNEGKIHAGIAHAGGVVGLNMGGTLQHAYNAGYVLGNEHVGGIVGQSIGESTLIQNENTGRVNGQMFVGGIAGEFAVGGKYHQLVNHGQVRGDQQVGGIVGIAKTSFQDVSNSGRIWGKDIVGGIAGRLLPDTKLTESKNSAEVHGENAQVGGIVGMSYGVVSRCSNTGKIWANEVLGGIVGHNAGTIDHAKNSGQIVGYRYIGGIAGISSPKSEIHMSDHDGGKIYSSDHTVGGIVGALKGGVVSFANSRGLIQGVDKVGGFVGEMSDNAHLVTSVTVAEVKGRRDHTGGIAGVVGAGSNVGNVHSAARVTHTDSLYGEPSNSVFGHLAGTVSQSSSKKTTLTKDNITQYVDSIGDSVLVNNEPALAHLPPVIPAVASGEQVQVVKQTEMTGLFPSAEAVGVSVSVSALPSDKSGKASLSSISSLSGSFSDDSLFDSVERGSVRDGSHDRDSDDVSFSTSRAASPIVLLGMSDLDSPVIPAEISANTPVRLLGAVEGERHNANLLAPRVVLGMVDLHAEFAEPAQQPVIVPLPMAHAPLAIDGQANIAEQPIRRLDAATKISSQKAPVGITHHDPHRHLQQVCCGVHHGLKTIYDSHEVMQHFETSLRQYLLNSSYPEQAASGG